MATTQRHIAERLQLSRSLVAGVLNDHPTVYASAETRRKVFEAAREMNYRPHAAARALRSGKTRVVTFCCANFDSLQEVSPKREIGMEGLLDSLAIALGKHDYKLQVEFVAQPQQWMAAMNEIATSRGCDAVVLWAEDSVSAAGARFLEERSIPFVVKGYYEAYSNWPQVEFDHAAMMEGAVSHLHALGHHRIAFAGNDHEAVYVDALENGFREAMRARDLASSLMARLSERKSTTDFVKSCLSLSPIERPTAFVLATNAESSWREAEIVLAQAGLCADETPAEKGGFGLCGLHPPRSPLLFGQAHAYDGAELSFLADIMCDQLLMPMLNGQELSDVVVRAHPELHKLESLKLHQLTLFPRK